MSIASGSNKGIKYEVVINRILKKRKLQQESVKSGGSSDAPDGYFRFKKTRYPLEIKKDLSADFAQVELNWKEGSGFIYSIRSKNPSFVKFLNKKTDFLSIINQKWTKKPRKFENRDLTDIDRNWDLDNFPDIKYPVDVSYIERYYNSKTIPVNYIQIGTKGFFFLGKDVANLGVPRINGKPYLRARIKTRSASKNKWGFLVAIKMRGTKPSTYDIEDLGNKVSPFLNGKHNKNA